MSTETIERPKVGDPALGQGDPIYAHIVKRSKGVTDAYILGTPIEAECGHVWVPSRDPERYPLCPKCKEIVDARCGDGEADLVR